MGNVLDMVIYDLPKNRRIFIPYYQYPATTLAYDGQYLLQCNFVTVTLLDLRKDVIETVFQYYSPIKYKLIFFDYPVAYFAYNDFKFYRVVFKPSQCSDLQPIDRYAYYRIPAVVYKNGDLEFYSPSNMPYTGNIKHCISSTFLSSDYILVNYDYVLVLCEILDDGRFQMKSIFDFYKMPWREFIFPFVKIRVIYFDGRYIVLYCYSSYSDKRPRLIIIDKDCNYVYGVSSLLFDSLHFRFLRVTRRNNVFRLYFHCLESLDSSDIVRFSAGEIIVFELILEDKPPTGPLTGYRIHYPLSNISEYLSEDMNSYPGFYPPGFIVSQYTQPFEVSSDSQDTRRIEVLYDKTWNFVTYRV